MLTSSTADQPAEPRVDTGAAGSARPLARRSHKKSKTGCKTCRLRKVKCDERRPLCRNCEKHFWNLLSCDFDDEPPRARPHRERSSPEAQAGAQHPGPAHDAVASATQTAAWPPPGVMGRAAEPLSLCQAVAPGRLDPFEARPESLSSAAGIDFLMQHYLSSFAYRSFPFYASKPLIELWWPFVREDQVLFHVILLLSSVDQMKAVEHCGVDIQQLPNIYQSRTINNQKTLHMHQLMDQCLSLLAQRVQDPIAGINDHTLVSIACLAALEHDRDNMRGLDAHLEGLKRAIELRGGIGVVRQENALAANLVFWITMVADSEPAMLSVSFPKLDYMRCGRWIEGMDQAGGLLTHDGLVTNLEAYGVDKTTAAILWHVQSLSTKYPSSLDNGSPAEATRVLTCLCSIIASLLENSRNPSNDSSVPGLSQSCRIAACLHVFAPMSGYFPNPTLMLHALVRDLKQSLKPMIRAVGSRSHLLLWLLAVGGITAHTMVERSWFVGHLVVVVTDLGIHTWEHMRQYLVMLAFHDNFCDINFHLLWDEVRQKQEGLSLTSGAVGGQDVGTWHENILVSGGP